jgi:hypothetical protein
MVEPILCNKVIRVTPEEFELEDGRIFPIMPPLEEDLTVEEFQCIYDKSCDIIRSI